MSKPGPIVKARSKRIGRLAVAISRIVNQETGRTKASISYWILGVSFLLPEDHF